MKDIFADLATKIMDTELTILMPDTRAVELDVLLQPGRWFMLSNPIRILDNIKTSSLFFSVYGLTNLDDLSSASNPISGNLFSVDYNRKSMVQR